MITCSRCGEVSDDGAEVCSFVNIDSQPVKRKKEKADSALWRGLG